MKIGMITAGTVALAITAASQAALYNVNYSLTGSYDEPWASPGQCVTTYNLSIAGQIDIVNGVAVSGTVTVTDNTVKTWFGNTSYGTWGDMSGSYSLFAGDGSGTVQSHWYMGFDNAFNVNAANPLSVGTSSYGGSPDRASSGGLMFVMDGSNPAWNAISIFQAEAGSGYSYGLKLNGIENDGGGVNGGSLSWSPVNVPAPGAAVLVGLTGLIGGRRRRA